MVCGGDPDLAPLVVGAHFDSANAAPCADDNTKMPLIAI